MLSLDAVTVLQPPPTANPTLHLSRRIKGKKAKPKELPVPRGLDTVNVERL